MQAQPQTIAPTGKSKDILTLTSFDEPLPPLLLPPDHAQQRKIKTTKGTCESESRNQIQSQSERESGQFRDLTLVQEENEDKLNANSKLKRKISGLSLDTPTSHIEDQFWNEIEPNLLITTCNSLCIHPLSIHPLFRAGPDIHKPSDSSDTKDQNEARLYL